MGQECIISPRGDNALTMSDVAVMAGNTWRHVGSPPLDLSLCCACHYHHHLTLDKIPSLDHVFTVSVDIGALVEVRVVSFNQILSSLPSYPIRSGFRLS